MTKPRKVEVPATSYQTTPKPAKRPAKDHAPSDTASKAIRYADHETFQKAAGKVFKTHGELFRKLAQ